ncbi:MAG TPA: glycosyltransferase family 2 protein [Terriglobales bacterium]|nr:glycosyltransferase family 2 protein [Terriglobales bacterium]
MATANVSSTTPGTSTQMNAGAEHSVLVSVVIPVRNEEKFIDKCLDTVIANSFPASQYEILVVDGESTDRSREIVVEKQSQFPNLRLLRNPQKVVPSGMNIGIRQAKGRYIIRMDAHSEYPTDYIANCIAELQRTGAANVGGRWFTRPGSDSLVAKTIAFITQSPAVVGNALYRLGKGDCYVDTVPFGAFRRDIFDKVGLFREDLVRHQDYELNARIRHAGGKIFLSPKIYNIYYNVPTGKKFMRQAYLNGVWCARAWTRYPVSFCWRHAVPLFFALGVLLLIFSGIALRPLFWPMLALFSVYGLSSLALGFRAARQYGWKYFFLAPVLMFSYHFVYGISTLFGFFDVVPGLWRVPQRSIART